MLRNHKFKILLSLIFLISYLIFLEYHNNVRLKDLISGMVKESYQQCEKVENIVFIKTHKCASSSLQNIFLRYGEQNNLNFAIPRSGHQLYGNNWNLVGNDYKNISYNIFCLHARFQYEPIAKVMGNTNRSKYITMIRDPVDIFVSEWEYYKLAGSYKMTLEEFARAPPSVTRRKQGLLGTNQLVWDLGVDDVNNEAKVEQKIKEMDEKFHLVMILEKFEESLILMKDLLCWNTEDIKNLKLNARKVDEEDELNPETRKLLQKIMAPDYKLYNYFKDKFEQKLDSFSQSRMQEELVQLDTVNTAVTKKCNIVEADNKKLSGQNKWWGSADLVGYKVENSNDSGNIAEECKLMTMSELSYIDRIRKYQKEKYPKLKK